MWQDTVLALGALVFLAALLPTLTSEDKPPVSTSVLIGFTLAVFSVYQFTLDLVMVGTISAVTSIMWFIVGVQKWQK